MTGMQAAWHARDLSGCGDRLIARHSVPAVMAGETPCPLGAAVAWMRRGLAVRRIAWAPDKSLRLMSDGESFAARLMVTTGRAAEPVPWRPEVDDLWFTDWTRCDAPRRDPITEKCR